MMNNLTPPLPDRNERERILHDLNINLLVEAAAGTGKTTSLVGRMIHLIGQGQCTIDRMAAVTFTRKAAAEMRSRFQVQLEKTLRQETGAIRLRMTLALQQIERCFIGTIHSFCARLLRERPVEAGVDIAFREIEEQEDQLLRRTAWEEYVAHLYAHDAPILTELHNAGMEIGLLQFSFQKMADYPDVDIWPAPPTPLPDLSPIRDALLEYVSHMEQISPTLSDDSGNDTLIPKYQTLPRLVKYHNLSDPVSLIKVLDECKKCKVIQKQWPGKKEQALQEMDRWDQFRETHVIPLQQTWYAHRYEISLRAIQPALEYYVRMKKQQCVLNFQDLLLSTATLLKRCPTVRRYFQQRISHLLVDEFQDTDPIQAEIMLLLTSDDVSMTDWRQCRPRPGSLFVVGDPKQSIYRFRRADIVTYNQVKEIILQNGGQTLHLSANFRTDPIILKWINPIFQVRFPPSETPFSPTYVPLQHGKPHADLADRMKIGQIAIPAEIAKNGEDSLAYESAFIARWIHQEIQAQRAKPDDFMIVAYLTKNLTRYAHELERLQIPYQITGGDTLNQVEELQLLTQCLTAIVQTWNSIALVSVLRNELFGFSDPELYAFKKQGGVFSYRENVPDCLPADLYTKYQDAFERLRLYQHWIKTVPPSTAIERICDHLGLFARASVFPDADIRCGCLAKAIAIVRSAQERFLSFGEWIDFFQQWIRKEIKLDGITATPPKSSVVRIMNLHKVKGLEAPIVFLADPTGKYDHPADLHIDRSQSLTQAFLTMERIHRGSYQRILLSQPANWDRYNAEEQQFSTAEKTRLYYVAATRCKQQLIITQREKNNHHNPWDYFSSSLENAFRLEPPKEVPTCAMNSSTQHPSNREAQTTERKRCWETIIKPTYTVAAISQLEHEGESALSSREEGTQWGILIHTLLEKLIRNPAMDVELWVERLVQKNALDPQWLLSAVHQIRAIQQSSLWQRAIQSTERFAEVPLRILKTPSKSNPKPTILRGVIDLIFKENNRWVLVDYKTDVSAQDNLGPLIQKYQSQILSYAREWERITQIPVQEKGFYFTETNQFISLQG